MTRLTSYPHVPDKGCPEATEELGDKQSHCLECPFPDCILYAPGHTVKQIKRAARNEGIKRLRKEGNSTKEIGAMLNIGVRTVLRALRQDG